MKERYSVVFVLVFFGLLLLPLRTLAFDPHAIEESFYLRPRLISLISDIRLSLGDRVFPKVLVGDHGWLVFTGEGDLDVYQQATLFTPDELARFQQDLDALSANYAERGITLLVIVPPSKNSIYPERVPPAVSILGTESRFNQLVIYLQEHGRTQLIDLRPALKQAKSEHQIYYATDTHWNDYGVYIAYSALMTELQKKYPNLALHPVSDFKIVEQEPELLDLSRNIGITLLRESKIQFLPQFDSHTAYKNINLGQRKLMLSYNPD